MNISNCLLHYGFSLILATGIGVGLLWSLGFFSTKKTKPDRKQLDTAAMTLTGAFVGGRVIYALINWHYYKDHLVEIATFWLGGISWFGALTGALLTTFIVTRFHKSNFAKMTDGFLPLFFCLVVSSWLSSWIYGCAYGVEVNTWWSVPAVDEWGLIAQRWPVALIGIFSALAFHVLTEYLQTYEKTKIPGLATCVELSGFSLTILLLTHFREDPMLKIAGIALDAWVSIGLLIGIGILATQWSLTQISRKSKLSAGQ